jgi:PmbA protein
MAQKIEWMEVAQKAVAQAMEKGASAAECVIAEGDEFSTNIRLGEVETLKESGSRAVGIRVFRGQRSANTSSSDLSAESIAQMVTAALELATVTSEDPFSGLPQAAELGQLGGDLKLFHKDVQQMPAASKIAQAKLAEHEALAADSRLTNSDGAAFDTTTGHKIYVNSLGFAGEFSRSYCCLSAAPIASDAEGNMQRDYWYTVGRSVKQLDSPEEVGRIAAQRTLRRLGARRVKTQKVPVVFDSQSSRALLGHIFEAVNGDAVYRHASYLAGKLGEKVAGENITIVDDGTMPGGFGTTPFDGEGVASRRTVVFENGQLASYLLNCYTAKKLGLKTTGNAHRGLAGTPGIGCGNFYLQPGNKSPEKIVSEIKQGLLVTEFLGFGVNLVTGDFSRGVSGQWIENGEIAYPVEEITVAGNLREMWSNVAEIGNDLEWRGSVACPTLRIEGMTVAGE